MSEEKIIVLASRNKGKLVEIEYMLQLKGRRFASLAEFPEIGEIPEDGATFEENAFQKAHTVMMAAGKIAMADDSGISVDALGGRPGVYSARFAGENATDQENNLKLLKSMNGIPHEKRAAKFVCVISVVAPNGNSLEVRGECNGYVTEAPIGNLGFGYDPLFFYPPMGKTFSEMTLSEKNGVSHRAMALVELKRKLPAFLAKTFG